MELDELYLDVASYTSLQQGHPVAVARPFKAAIRSVLHVYRSPASEGTQLPSVVTDCQPIPNTASFFVTIRKHAQ